MNSNKKHIFPVVFISGILLLIIGIGTAYLNVRFNALTGALTAAGVFILAVSVITVEKNLRELFSKVSMGQIIWNILVVASLCACLLAVNVLAGRYN